MVTKKTIKPLTRIEAKKILKRYNTNEDKNYHSENAVMLIKRFGTRSDEKRGSKVMRNRKIGEGINKKDWDFLYKKGHSHYHKLTRFR